MDQVTRMRMHKELAKQFNRAVRNIEGTDLMPSRAMHPVGIVTLNGVPYQVQMVLEEYRGEVFTYGVRKGLRNTNPISEVAGATEGKRDRYITDDELAAVRAAALVGNDGRPTPSGAAIVALIDLAYQTAQRIGDLLALNWADVSNEGIMFHPTKTVNSSGVRMLVEMTPDLQATLDGAKAGKAKAIGPVICTQTGGRFTYSGAQTAWKRACQRAREKCEKACKKEGKEPSDRHLVGMHFHDLRAKALTDKRRQEGPAAAQALAGHTTAEMTAHYTKAREIERVRLKRTTSN